MKVLYIAHYFLPNTAAGITTREVIEMLLRKSHQVTLIAPSTYANNSSTLSEFKGFQLKSSFSGIPNWIARKYKLIAMFIATLGYVFVFIAGLRTIKEEGPFNRVIVQYHTFHLAPFIGYILSKLAKAPLVVKIHDVVPKSRTKYKIESIFCNILSRINGVSLVYARIILSLSAEISQFLVKYMGVQASRIKVLPNSVSLNNFPSSLLVSKHRNLLGLEGKKIVLFLASFFEDRGLDVLFRALRSIRDKRLVSVVLGECGEKYVELAKQMNIYHKVLFVGQVGHGLVPLYINMADVCVGPLVAGPYTHGAVPRKVIECMACGKPLIVAEGAVTKDLAIDRVSALVVNSGDEDEVAHAILSLTTNSKLSMGIGAQARKTIAEWYSTERLADKLDKILQNLVD